MNQLNQSQGTATVARAGSVISVVVEGEIDESLTAYVQSEIERELSASETLSSIMIDGRKMCDPSLSLVLLMQSFHYRLLDRIKKSAIIVSGYRLAFLSRLAFGQDEKKYRVFYDDQESALYWLQT